MGQTFDPDLTHTGIKCGKARKRAERDKRDAGRIPANRRLGVFLGAFPFGNGFSLIIAVQFLTAIKQRQAEGIVAAKAKGKKFGRPAMKIPENFDTVYAAWRNGEITAKRALEMLGMKTTSFFKLVRIKNKR